MTFPRSRFKPPGRPTDCPQCNSLRGMNRHWLASKRRASTTTIQTWCRVCGKAALVEVPNDYDMALEHVHWIDDQPTSHEGHYENGGWGVHWRLDDVLREVFPAEHWDELFPMPRWYPHYDGLGPRITRVTKRICKDPFL